MLEIQALPLTVISVSTSEFLKYVDLVFTITCYLHRI